MPCPIGLVVHLEQQDSVSLGVSCVWSQGVPVSGRGSLEHCCAEQHLVQLNCLQEALLLLLRARLPSGFPPSLRRLQPGPPSPAPVPALPHCEALGWCITVA